MPDNTDRTSLGLDANVAAALAYFLAGSRRAILLVTERQNRFVRFHALQSMIVFGDPVAGVVPVPLDSAPRLADLLHPDSAAVGGRCGCC